MLKFISRVFLILAVCQPFVLEGQQVRRQNQAEQELQLGLELLERRNFVSAQHHFQRALEGFPEKELHRRGKAAFYHTLCAIELFNNDAEFLIREFINTYPDNQKVNQAFFELGKLRYRQQNWRDAIYWFRQTKRGGLDKEQRAELIFKLGYSHYSLDELEPANRAFFEIKDTQNRYSSPATYYYSHIAYIQGNYATALRGFERLSTDETFARLTPYYITQILFLQGKYERVVEYATPVLEVASTKRAPEIARVIGEALFRLRRYPEAVPFIERYIQLTPTLSREDKYLIGFVYYRNNQFEEAVKYLERVPTEEDLMSQNAYFHLADCYLRLNDKAKARQAFSMASKSDFDPEIKKDALFNFAKITFETLYNPFNEAIDAFNLYLQLYPKSHRADEAHNYLMQAYASTRNYRLALESLDRITIKDAQVKRSYQRVAFFRGIELFQNLQFEQATQAFTLSLKYPEFDRTFAALSLYWRGEAYYRLEQFDRASSDYNLFLLSPGAFDLPEYRMAHYNLGYSEFKQKNYDSAIVWFRKFASLSQATPSQHLGDAFNRIADSYFIQRRYWVALDFYQNAITTNTLDVDYALFQKGFTFGLVERPERKLETLNILLNRFPASNFIDDALFEMGESFLATNRMDEAIGKFRRIESQFPSSSYYVRALVQMGLIEYNRNNPDLALQHFKRVIEAYPGTPEAKNALIGLRNIYVDKGDVDSYIAFAATLGSLGNVSLAEKDSLLFMSSEKLYMSGDCDKSVQSIRRYLQEFPKGNFMINAHFYLADCLYRKGELEAALQSFNQVVQRQKNPFTEGALLSAARIYTQLNQHENAFKSYSSLETLAEAKSNLLEARVGMIRSAWQLSRHADVIAVAARALATEKLPLETEREIRMLRANALRISNRNEEAFNEYAWLAGNLRTQEGAQSKYLMARIHFDKGDMEKAEAEVFNFVQSNTPHQYWLAKSFILLADIYAQRNDFFQAKATLQSVIDGYDDTKDGILEMATDRLFQMIRAEKEKQRGNQADTIRIDWTF